MQSASLFPVKDPSQQKQPNERNGDNTGNQRKVFGKPDNAENRQRSESE
jgi:hypothetical protein